MKILWFAQPNEDWIDVLLVDFWWKVVIDGKMIDDDSAFMIRYSNFEKGKIQWDHFFLSLNEAKKFAEFYGVFSNNWEEVNNNHPLFEKCKYKLMCWDWVERIF